jgi:hypothetical protein
MNANIRFEEVQRIRKGALLKKRADKERFDMKEQIKHVCLKAEIT